MDSSDNSALKPARSIPWVEKYRPEKVDDVSHQDEVIQTLKTSIKEGSLPHLMFHGPPGTGKTTTILAVARALYGPELYKQRILELNASDERGIQVIREKVKTFAQGAVGEKKTSGYPCPRFKIIILDEADTMTPDAQSALRRIMELYSKVTRFCLICNYVTRIIEPLASRCAKFRFRPLPVSSMVSRMTQIAEMEHVELDEDALNTILVAARGDMRKAVTYLQSAHQLSSKGLVTSSLVIDISARVPDSIMSKLWESISSNRFDKMKSTVSDIVSEGYPMLTLLSQFHDQVIRKETLSDLDKALICEKISQAEFCLIDSSSEYLQLCDLIAFVMRRVGKNSSTLDSMMVDSH